jgi:hypothetical protein
MHPLGRRCRCPLSMGSSISTTTMKPRLIVPALLPVFCASALAVDFYGLSTSGDRLVSFNMSGTLTGNVPISGLAAGDSLVDIDVFFSGDRRLYGLGTSGTLYTLDPNTGSAAINVAGAAVGSPVAIDFNPVPDRLRVLSGPSNFRITPGTGVVSSDGLFTFAVGDANAGATPTLRAAAYINNVDNPGATSLYTIDTGLDALILHSGGPGFSTLNTVAGLSLGGNPFDVGRNVGFDVFSTAVGDNQVFMSNGNDLYRLNLANGVLAPMATVGGGVDLRTIAVQVPEASTVVPSVAGLLGAVWMGYRRVRKSAAAVAPTAPAA